MGLFDWIKRKNTEVQNYFSLNETKKSYGNQSKFYYNQGIALYKLRRFSEAEASFRRAIQLNPSFSWACCNLAVLLDELGRHQEALQFIDKAILLEPNDHDFLKRRNEILKNLERAKDGLKQIKLAVNKSFQDITLDIVRLIHNGNTIIFCGAGISVNSGLPLARPFTESILAKLNASEVEINLLRKATLPFESFMSILQENSSIEMLLEIFEKGEPNTNHILIANIMVLGKINIVVTTNFDMLIEQALSKNKKRWIEGEEYNVYYREEDYHKIDWQDNRPKLIKIHGSVHDKKKMAITMQQVAGKMYSEARKEIINRIFGYGSHEHVLIMGYSSSDSFDILPHIRAIKNGHRKITIVEHDMKADNIVRIEDIRLRSYNNPFTDFTNSIRLYCNTDNLVQKIWNMTLESPYENVLFKGNNLWTEYICKWYVEFNSKAVEHLLVGSVLLDINKYKEAAKHFKLAVNASQITGDKKREAFSLSLLGSITRSVVTLERALTTSREIDDKNQQANCLCSLAPIYYFNNQIEKAVKYCEDGLYIAKAIGDKSREARLLGNLGSISGSIGENENAIKYFELAFQISHEIGDKAAEGTSLFNIGLVYKRVEKLERAKEYYEKSLQALSPFLGDEHPVVKNVEYYLWIEK